MDFRWISGWELDVKVVLNSLSHDDYIPKSLSYLRKGGRFMEIGIPAGYLQVLQPLSIAKSSYYIDTKHIEMQNRHVIRL